MEKVYAIYSLGCDFYDRENLCYGILYKTKTLANKKLKEINDTKDEYDIKKYWIKELKIISV